MQNPNKLFNVAAWFFIIALLIVALIYGRNLLIPIAMAAFLSMLLLPVKRKLMSWRLPQWVAVMLSELMLLLFLGGLFALVSAQAMNFSNDLPQITEKATERYKQAKEYVLSKAPVTEASFDSTMIQAPKTILAGLSGQLQSIFSATTTGMVNFSMTIVYTFLFLLNSSRIREFLIRAGSQGNDVDTKAAIGEIASIAPSYLTGKMALVTFLAIAYSVGLTIIGVQYSLLFGVLAAMLSIIPYIGNMLGSVFPVLITFLNSETMWPILAIFLVFAIAQFLESYILEPIIVGSNVDINPMTTIIGVVVIGSFWGLPGMIIAIPLLGIVKIMFSHVESLKPFAYLMGDDSEPSAMEKRIKGWVLSIKKKITG